MPYVARKCYGVATISRLLKIIGLFCRDLSLLYGSFAKETYNLKEPTNRSHPILNVCVHMYIDIKQTSHKHIIFVFLCVYMICV